MTIEITKYPAPIVRDDPIWNLVKAGYRPHVLHDTDVDKICADLARVTDDVYGLYLGIEDGVAKGFFILVKVPPGPCSMTPFCSMPYLHLLHNSGSPAMLTALLQAIKSTVRDKAGLLYFAAINDANSGTPDDVWARAFGPAGKPKSAGSLFWLDVST